MTTGTFTRLMRASAFGNLELVKDLLNEGAEINEKGPRGSTALMFAASGGYLEIVRELVSHGADVGAEEDGGWSALRHAEEDGHRDVASFLVSCEQSDQNRRHEKHRPRFA